MELELNQFWFSSDSFPILLRSSSVWGGVLIQFSFSSDSVQILGQLNSCLYCMSVFKNKNRNWAAELVKNFSFIIIISYINLFHYLFKIFFFYSLENWTRKKIMKSWYFLLGFGIIRLSKIFIRISSYINSLKSLFYYKKILLLIY